MCPVRHSAKLIILEAMPEYVMIVPARMKNGMASMGKDSALAIILCMTTFAGMPVGQKTKYDSAEIIRQKETGMFSANITSSNISGNTTIYTSPPSGFAYTAL